FRLTALLVVVTIDHQMGPFFSEHPKVFVTLSLLLILCSYHSNSLSSTFLTLLVLAFSISFLFYLDKMKLLCKLNTTEKPPELQFGLQSLPQDEIDLEENKATQEGEGKFPLDELVLRSTKSSLECQGLNGDETDRHALLNGSFSSDKAVLENPSPSECFTCSLSDHESLAENVRQLVECSEGSISDDDNLIEISISHGHYVVPEESSQLKPEVKVVSPPDFLPETVCRQHGLMELFPEIIEEDNLIEIDIAEGCTKCSRMGIKS
ncbi:uncharacterized protein, partial [Elaeis guineensis]